MATHLALSYYCKSHRTESTDSASVLYATDTVLTLTEAGAYLRVP